MKAGDLSVNWRYSEDKRNTTCSVGVRSEGGTFTELASATIRRFHKDQFEYEKARKTSLKRALATLYPDHSGKEARASVWQSYFNRKLKK